MTDREALLALLERFGLSPTAEGRWPTDEKTVTLAAKQGGVDGYDGFFGVFLFDEAGAFQNVHLWE